MNSDVKEKWLAALRSGTYRQTSGLLCRVDPKTGEKVGHCCLGVLADVMGIPAGRISAQLDALEFNFPYGEKGIGYLPDAWADEIGLTEFDQHTLGEKNDHGQSFNQIADWIEEKL